MIPLSREAVFVRLLMEDNARDHEDDTRLKASLARLHSADVCQYLTIELTGAVLSLESFWLANFKRVMK